MEEEEEQLDDETPRRVSSKGEIKQAMDKGEQKKGKKKKHYLPVSVEVDDDNSLLDSSSSVGERYEINS